MSLDSVYILEPGTMLRRDGNTLLVMKGELMIDQIPAAGLKRLLLIGYISLTGAVLDFLIKNRVETVFITPTGRFRARLAIDEHRHVALRKAQYLKLNDQQTALIAARSIVKGKVENMTRFLMTRSRQYSSKETAVTAARLKSLMRTIEETTDVGSLRGLEGAATRIYFGTFPHLIRNEDFTFNGRNRRPPLDPVNALLSFVYTLLTNEVLSSIKTHGLDPYMGSLHEIEYGRPSLACDLVEEYRSFLGDRFVLGLINRKMVKPDDFIFRDTTQPADYADEEDLKAHRPVQMKPEICRTFIKSYEEMMNSRIHYSHTDQKVSYRQLILQQIRRFSEFLKDEKAPYQPFLWET